MSADPRIAALPAVRKLAEEQADAINAAMGLRLSGGGVEALRAACLAIASDVGIAASRDAVARLVAEAVGMACGVTAPTFHRVFPCWWEMVCTGRAGIRAMVFCEPADVESDPTSLRGHKVGVTGISAVTDPAEALALIALAVLS